MVRGLLGIGRILKSFWLEAVNWSIHVLNRSPTFVVQNMTLEEAWSGRRPNRLMRSWLMMLEHVLFLSAYLFSIGIFGLITSRNMVRALMCLELILNAVSLNLVTFSQVGDVEGPASGSRTKMGRERLKGAGNEVVHL